MVTPLLQIQEAQRAQTSGNFYSSGIIHGFFKNYPFARQLFHLSSSLLQMTIVLHPSRIRHNIDTDADVQQGPVQRILFRLRPCVNFFYCLLLIHIHRWEGCWRLGMWPRQNNARTWTQGASYKGHYLGPVYTTKTEYLRECSASRVWPYMHQLRIMSLVKCWVCPAPMFWYLTFRYIG